MIELPRAAVTAGRIATVADFFSFGTNDLTQMTWGFSRDDVEAAFFSTYLDHGVFPVSPFESLDVEGVGGWSAWPSRPDRMANPGSTSGCAASTAAILPRSTSSTRPVSTTCPARRSGCRSPGSRRGGREHASSKNFHTSDGSVGRPDLTW